MIQLHGTEYRSIPAWAGEPRVPFPFMVLIAVYPRVGGGTGIRRRSARPWKGLSPRGRGNRA